MLRSLSGPWPFTQIRLEWNPDAISGAIFTMRFQEMSVTKTF